LKACRSEEFLMPALCDRNSYETWEGMGQPDAYDKARQKVEEILSSPPRNPLPDDVVGKLEEIMRKAARELAPES
jgi:trimethylamine:corrinoid methyltransferase-like protein